MYIFITIIVIHLINKEQNVKNNSKYIDVPNLPVL